MAKADKDDENEEQSPSPPRPTWSAEFLALIGSAPDFPYLDEPAPPAPEGRQHVARGASPGKATSK